MEPNLPFLDYSRRKYAALNFDPEKNENIRPNRHLMGKLFRESVERITAFMAYNRQKEGKLQELIRTLKR